MTPIVNRIVKLRALAGSSNPHEAKAAREKAEELRKKHNIAQDTIEAAEATAKVASGVSGESVYTRFDPWATVRPTTSTPTPGGSTEAPVFGYTAPGAGEIDVWVVLEFPGKNKKAWIVELASLLANLHDCVAWGYENKILAAGFENKLDVFIASLDAAMAEVEAAWASADKISFSEASYKLGATHRVVERINVEKHRATLVEAAGEAFAKASGFFQGLVNAFKAGYSVARGSELEKVQDWLSEHYEIDDPVLRSLVFGNRVTISDEQSYEAGRSERV